MSRQYWLETYGCQMNFAESEAMALELNRAGWREAPLPEEADLVLLNTCTVRQTADNRVWGRLGYYKRLKSQKELTLVITGCMAERARQEIREKAPHVDHVLGNFEKQRLIPLLNETEGASGSGDGGYRFHDFHSRDGDIDAMVPIMHGCDNYCTYCIVPYVRGPEISRPPEAILAELRGMEQSGIREVTLLGQNVNSYQYGGESGAVAFSGLLRMILKETGLPWIRFISSNPQDFTPELLAVIADNPRLCRHIHLPVQHGSDKILKAMNRQYSRGEYLELVGQIKESLPGVSLTSDVMVGFPGETEGDLDDVFSLLKRAEFEDAFTYYYNPREGTAAWDFPHEVPEPVRLERLGRVIEAQQEISREVRSRRIGTEETALVEGLSKKDRGKVIARTGTNSRVVLTGGEAMRGSFKNVRLEALTGVTFQGKEV